MGLFNWWQKIWSGVVDELERPIEWDADITQTDAFTTDDAMDDDFCINPANGNPMIGGMGGLDIEGNVFGMDSSFDDIFNDDMFS